MKSTGIVREVDSLGRIVFPMELRNIMMIAKGDPLEIFVDGEKIMLKKYYAGCLFCGNGEELENIKGKYVCKACLEEIKENVSLE